MRTPTASAGAHISTKMATPLEHSQAHWRTVGDDWADGCGLPVKTKIRARMVGNFQLKIN
jgi:hypothetical protein